MFLTEKLDTLHTPQGVANNQISKWFQNSCEKKADLEMKNQNRKKTEKKQKNNTFNMGPPRLVSNLQYYSGLGVL